MDRIEKNMVKKLNERQIHDPFSCVGGVFVFVSFLKHFFLFSFWNMHRFVQKYTERYRDIIIISNENFGMNISNPTKQISFLLPIFGYFNIV